MHIAIFLETRCSCCQLAYLGVIGCVLVSFGQKKVLIALTLASTRLSKHKQPHSPLELFIIVICVDHH